MRIQCAWCLLDMGRKPPFDDHTTSHGICEKCSEKVLAEMEEVKSKKQELVEVS